MRFSLLALVTTLALLTGCGDSKEHKLQQAGIALSAGNADVALKLADQVLEVEPASTTALMLKSRAHLRLRQYDVAEKLFLKLVENKEIALDCHRELMLLALARMLDLINRSEFVDNAEMQEQFTAAKTLGHDQADWLIEIGGQPVEGEFFRARLILTDTQRIEKELKAERARLKSQGEEQGTEITNVAIETRQRQIDVMRLDAEKRLLKVLELQGDHFQAAALLLGLQGPRSAWSEIWELSAHLCKQADVTVALATDMVELLRQMPDHIQKDEARLSRCVKVLEAVSEQGRQSSGWKTSRAMVHLRRREAEKAHDLALEAFRASSQDEKARFTLAWALYDLGKNDQAKALLQDLASQRRDDTDIQALYGMILAKLGDNALAIDSLRRAVDLNRNNHVARAMLIRLNAESKGTVALVTDDIDKLYEGNRTDPQAIRFKFVSEVGKGSKQTVGALMAAVAKIVPLKKEHLQILVEGYIYLREIDKAADCARQLVNEHPDDVESHLAMTRIRLIKGDVTGARKTLEDLGKKFPDSPEVGITLSEMLLASGAYDRSIEVIEGVLKQNPNQLDARLLLAQGLSRLSLIPEAMEQISLVLEKTPDNARALAMAAAIQESIGQRDQAQDYWSRVDEAQIDAKRFPGVLAQLKLHRGQTAEALDVCRQAISAGSTDPLVRLTIAAIHGKSNNFAEEEAHLIGFIRDNPNDYLPYQLLVRFYVKNSAERGLSQFVALRSSNEPMARLAESAIYRASGRNGDATRTLAEIFDRLIQKRDPMALTYARQMASYMLSGTSSASPQDVFALFQKLIDAKLFEHEASLTLIDLTWRRPNDQATLDKLDLLASKITAVDETLFARIIQRYRALGKIDLAVEKIDRRLKGDEANPSLLVAKSTMLLESGKPREAAAVLVNGAELHPDQAYWHELIGQAWVAAGDFPAAEAAYADLSRYDTSAKIRSLWARGNLFARLGLRQAAVQAFRELDKVTRQGDPRVNLALGQGLFTLDQNAEAFRTLSLIPRSAREYPSAQMLMVQIDQREGRMEEAKRRLEALAKNRQTIEAAIRELVTMSLRNREQEQLLKWSDKVLQLDNLPPVLRRQWLAVRLAIHNDAKDWANLERALGQIETVDNNPTFAAARVAVLARLNQHQKASQLLASNTALAQSEMGALLAIGLTGKPPKDARLSPVAAYLAALADGNLDVARSAASSAGSSSNSYYANDLEASVDKAGADPVIQVKKLALAMVAGSCGVEGLAEEISKEVVEAAPKFAPAHGLLLASLSAKHPGRADARARVLKELPASTLAIYVNVLDSMEAKKFQEAIDFSKKLLEKSPSHALASYRLVNLYEKVGRPDDALAQLEKLHQSPGALREVVANEVAYLLANQRPSERGRASQIAAEVVKRNPTWAPALDTLGWIEYLKGEHASALVNLSKALPGLAQEPECHYHLGVVYQALGNSVWARRHLEVAAAAPPTESYVNDASERIKAISGK